jgi:hypothetical protein
MGETVIGGVWRGVDGKRADIALWLIGGGRL